MNNNEEDSRFAFRFFVGLNLLFLIGFVVVIFVLCCDSASALEIRSADRVLQKNNETWYGYDIPTRATLTDSQGSGVHVNLAYRNSLISPNKWTMDYSNFLKMGLRTIDSDILDYASENNIDLSSLVANSGTRGVWSETLNTNQSFFDRYMVYGFRPGGMNNSLFETLEDGFTIDYGALYSYSFDIIMYNPNMTDYKTLSNVDQCDDSIQWSCITRNNVTIDKLIDTPKLQYYRYTVSMTSTWNPWGFNFSTTLDDTKQYGVYGANLWANQNYINSYTKIIFSQPYNITYWTNSDESAWCDETCWTQSDTDANQRIVNDGEYIWDAMGDLVKDFDFHGFSDIPTLTFNFIVSLLNDANDSCVSLNVPIMNGVVFTLPSSCYFWNRQNVSDFKTIYHLFWLGLISYYIGWRIFKDIMNLYNPEHKIINGNEVDSL